MMRIKVDEFLVKFWYVLLGLGVVTYMLPGCSSWEDMRLGSKVAYDAVAEHGVAIIGQAATGDWGGTILTVGAALAGAVGTYFTARRIRRNKRVKNNV